MKTNYFPNLHTPDSKIAISKGDHFSNTKVDLIGEIKVSNISCERREISFSSSLVSVSSSFSSSFY